MEGENQDLHGWSRQDLESQATVLEGSELMGWVEASSPCKVAGPKSDSIYERLII